MKYRKKPVVIEAVRYEGNGVIDGLPPEWLWKALQDKIALPTNGGDPFIIKTLEGDHTVSPGDFIIQGVKGELYPCKPDIFAATYEPVGECDACENLDPKEDEQAQGRVHTCVLLGRHIRHLDRHPSLPRPGDCPLIKEPQE